MGTATEAKAKDVSLEPILAADAELLKYVDETKTYRFTLQLGNGRRWRKYGPGKVLETGREKMPGREGDQVTYTMKPAVHDAAPVTGKTLNGLISEHNKFVEANHRQNGLNGLIGRMLIVKDIREVEEMPDEPVRGGLSTMQLGMIKAIVSETVKETVTALMETMKNNRGGSNRS